MNPEIIKYVAKIRNQGKRAYADDLYRCILRGDSEPDYHKYEIGYMAAQAVRLQIGALLPKLPAVKQKPCDVGLFSDEKDQLDLIEMFQDPVED